ncbi:capsid protein [Capybara virus 31_cap3_4029]|nr:capsid protein [Capybara virus 31_cap3_4029]QDJ95270.1 capsid protein [Capybara virus 32_cap3_4374]
MFYKKRRYQRKPRKVVKKRYPRKRVSASVKKYVNRIVHRNIENKSVVTCLANQAILTGTGGTAFYINLCPQISQGPGSNGRLGDTVTFRKCVIRGLVNLLPYSALVNFSLPVRVRIMLLSSKQQMNAVTSGIAPSFSNLFQINGSEQGFYGDVRDTLLDINKASWILHAQKTFNLSPTIANCGGFAATSTVWADNSKMQLPFYFDFSKHLKLARFDDGSNYITNKNLYIVITAVAADGGSGTTQGCECHYNIRWDYEDA